MDESKENAALGVLQVVGNAVVQKPEQWDQILKSAVKKSGALVQTVAFKALQELETSLRELDAKPDDAALNAVAVNLMGDEKPSLSFRLSARALAGQALINALNIRPR